VDTGNKGSALRSYRADADAVGFASNPNVANIDIVTSHGQVVTG
jgi:hypothetical protein